MSTKLTLKQLQEISQAWKEEAATALCSFSLDLTTLAYTEDEIDFINSCPPNCYGVSICETPVYIVRYKGPKREYFQAGTTTEDPRALLEKLKDRAWWEYDNLS